MKENYIFYASEEAARSIYLYRFYYMKDEILYYCRIRLKIQDDDSLLMLMKNYLYGEYPDDMDTLGKMHLFQLGNSFDVPDYVKATLLLQGVRPKTIDSLQELLKPELFAYDEESMTFIDDVKFAKEFTDNIDKWALDYKCKDIDVYDFLY